MSPAPVRRHSTECGPRTPRPTAIVSTWRIGWVPGSLIQSSPANFLHPGLILVMYVIRRHAAGSAAIADAGNGYVIVAGFEGGHDVVPCLPGSDPGWLPPAQLGCLLHSPQ